MWPKKKEKKTDNVNKENKEQDKRGEGGGFRCCQVICEMDTAW